jgi:hypothetical protein
MMAGAAWEDWQTLRFVAIEPPGCSSLPAQCIAELALVFATQWLATHAGAQKG